MELKDIISIFASFYISYIFLIGIVARTVAKRSSVLIKEKTMIVYEKEILEYLGLPSIPKKIHDGVTSFERGVAVVNLYSGKQAYAVATFNAEKNDSVRIKKTFGLEPFVSISQVYVVPNYMTQVEDIDTLDLDEESKKRAQQILNEVNDIVNEGVDDGVVMPEHEYYFDFINNDSEARAFIEAHNKKNKIRGRIPTTHEGLLMRLSVIYSDTNKQV